MCEKKAYCDTLHHGFCLKWRYADYGFLVNLEAPWRRRSCAVAVARRRVPDWGFIGTNMIADLFTKALDKGQFYKLRDVMMNHHAPLRDALSVAMCQMHGSASRLAQRLSRQL